MFETGANGFWNFLGSLGGAGINAWSTNYNRKKSESFNAAQADLAAKRSYKYWQKSLVYGPSLQRQGLEKAGYNPMLALGNIGSSFSGASASASSSPVASDVVGSARQGAELINDLQEAFKNQNDKAKAEVESIKDANSRANKESAATVKNIEADTKLKGSQKTNTEKNTWLDNPIVAPLAGLLGGAAAEKVGAMLGGSAKDAAKAPIVKAWEAAAKKGAPKALGIGSKMLRGISLPLLFGSSAIGAYHQGSKAYPEYSKEVKKHMRKQTSGFGLPIVY